MKRKVPVDPPKARALVVERNPDKASQLSAFLFEQGFDHVATATEQFQKMEGYGGLPTLVLSNRSVEIKMHDRAKMLPSETSLTLNTLLATIQQLLAAPEKVS